MRGITFVRVAMLALAGTLGSCQGAKQGLDPLAVANFNYSANFGGVAINAPLELTFTAPVDGSSITADSIRIFTTTTTTTETDPGAPAIGDFTVSGNIVRFLPRVPQVADLSDAGLRIGFTYTVQVPAAPDVISPVRTVEGDPNVVRFVDFFTTINQTILPSPADITAEPNLNTLPRFFIDEGIQNGVDSCPRADLPEADRDSPQVIFTDPQEGETGFGTITGIQAGLGTAFVRLDPITIMFSEPVGPWRIRAEDITIRNDNLGGETFDLFFFFTQDRSQSKLQITVFDADSAFDQASVPQGLYVLSLQNFSDLAGNPLVNTSPASGGGGVGNCVADGTFQLSFSTVSSPALPTNVRLTFADDDQDGHVDLGGLATPTRDVNVLPEHERPFLGGVASGQPGVGVVSPSAVTTTANWGNTGYWTGAEVRLDNGFDPVNLVDRPVHDALRLRGGAVGAATPVLAPIAGDASGRSNVIAGSPDGSVSAPGGRVDFNRTGGSARAFLFTGDATTGPIVYQYRRFTLLEDGTGRPLLAHQTGSLFPLIILVEEDAVIAGDIVLDGLDGQFGLDGLNDGSSSGLSRTVGGRGGNAGPGGGRGGNGGGFTFGTGNPELLNGQTGSVPANVLGPLDHLNEAMAGAGAMAPGGGGHYDATQSEDNTPGDVFIPNYQGGGGGSYASSGTGGADSDATSPGASDQGVGGAQYGNLRNDPPIDFGDPDVLSAGGAGGGGGGSDDDSQGGNDPNGNADFYDDGGGGGGGGGGFFGLAAGGDITFGIVNDNANIGDPDDDTLFEGLIRCVGGRGGSTYNEWTGDPPVPGDDPANPDPTAGRGSGDGGGGGGGGGICLIAGGNLSLNVGEMLVYGKAGGNAPDFEGTATRDAFSQAGNGGGGIILLQDSDGIDRIQEFPPANTRISFTNDPTRDFGGDDPGVADPQDYDEMTGIVFVPDNHVYGNDPRERLFGESAIVTEFFDTLSDRVSYSEVRVLSNAPRYSYSATTPSMRTIRVLLDTTSANGVGFPDLGGEDSSGRLDGIGGTVEADNLDSAHDATFPLSSGDAVQRNRFARVRILFDLVNEGDPDELLASFAPLGAPDEVIADDPGTPQLDNGLGNTDVAPAGVPAVAEVRVRFIP